MRTLDRKSEIYSSQGGMAAQGIKRLLGAPSMDQLQTTIREAVQNSWDASVGTGKTPSFHVHLRQLSNDEMEVFRNSIFSNRLLNDSNSSIDSFLGKSNPWVLELSDVGTTGLGGETDASAITPDGESTDFMDFVWNLGSPRDTEHGGGTYGYGKSSLYALSQCGTIVIDSLTNFRGRSERRLIACRVASSLTVKSGAEAGKYTGRHWWGRLDPRGERIAPETGDGATRLAQGIGTLMRESEDYGTSIVILDPPMEDGPQKVLNRIQRTLLWNFWPKMVRYESGPAIVFFTRLNGEVVPIPEPESCPPLGIFVRSMRKLKAGEGSTIECFRPNKALGLLSIHKDLKEDRISGFLPGDDGMFPETACHVALMRPVELVVKYLAGSPLPSTMLEWGGVFVCSDDDEVEEAFARAEPPAHDDWVCESLEKGRLRTWVRVALKRIGEQMQQVVGASSVNVQGGRIELAALSNRLGSLLPGARGDAPSPSARGSKPRVGSGMARDIAVKDLEGIGPDVWCDGTSETLLAWFSFAIDSRKEVEVEISGAAKVFIDGENSDVAPDGTRPEIRIWLDDDTDGDRKVIGRGECVRTTVKGTRRIAVGISIPAGLAVSFYPEVTVVTE